MERLFVLGAGALLLVGCEAQIGMDEAQKTPTAGVAKAETGTLSIDAPGFNMKLKIPDAVRAQVSGDADLVYPGATLGGLHVAAGADGAGANGSVAMRFTAPDPLQQVAAWYQDPARAAKLAVTESVRQETGMVITGTSAGEGSPFTLRLTPADGGGTDGRLVLSARAG